MKEKFYVTTPIYYSNGAPHIGSCYTTLAADIISRWNKLQGKEVFFLTGTDEHGKKIQEVAEKNKKTPKKFVDEIAKKYYEIFSKMNFSYDNFIRTTDSYHEKEVLEVLQKLFDKGLIYKGEYESYYCVGCEQYLKKSDLVDGKCPLHNTIPELKKEESYLFKLSQFQDRILKAIESGEMQIVPEKRKNEMVSFINQGLQDISFSRKKQDVSWGIELPFDKEHTCYVWIDAFWNYISGLKEHKKFWPAQVQLMANDILRVHSTIWPALLLALEKPLPNKLFIHGYFTLDGKKMSKSLGNFVDPADLLKKYSPDTIRYFFMRNIPFGDDGDFSEKAMIDRHNGELVNKFGNLITRLSSLIEKNGIEESEKKIEIENLELIKTLIENLEFDKALNEIFSYIDKCNEYIQVQKPWETKDKKILYELANAIKKITILLYSFIPETCEKISKQFNFKISLEELEKPLKISKIKKSSYLFERIEVLEENNKINKPEKIKEIMVGLAQVEFSDWQKLDLRVAQIVSVEEIENADKLYKIEIDVGELGKRTICAGLKAYYSIQDLLGKKIIYFSNLKPRTMKGIESQGMLLAAYTEDESKVILLTPSGEIENGSRIG